jgi:hypothetical protein
MSRPSKTTTDHESTPVEWSRSRGNLTGQAKSGKHPSEIVLTQFHRAGREHRESPCLKSTCQHVPEKPISPSILLRAMSTVEWQARLFSWSVLPLSQGFARDFKQNKDQVSRRGASGSPSSVVPHLAGQRTGAYSAISSLGGRGRTRTKHFDRIYQPEADKPFEYSPSRNTAKTRPYIEFAQAPRTVGSGQAKAC